MKMVTRGRSRDSQILKKVAGWVNKNPWKDAAPWEETRIEPWSGFAKKGKKGKGGRVNIGKKMARQSATK